MYHEIVNIYTCFNLVSKTRLQQVMSVSISFSNTKLNYQFSFSQPNK